MKIWKKDGEYMIDSYDRGTVHLVTALLWFCLALVSIWLVPFFGVILGGLLSFVAFIIFVDAVRTRAIYKDGGGGYEYIGHSRIDIILEFIMPWFN